MIDTTKKIAAVTYNGVSVPLVGITPSGTINITDTALTDVAEYANAQVVDANLVASNIKKDVSILGITGTFEGGGGGGDTYKLTSIVAANANINNVFNAAQLTPQSTNEVLIWNIRGTLKQTSGSIGAKMGFVVVQNGQIVDNANVYRRSTDMVAPDSMLPSTTPINTGVFNTITDGKYAVTGGQVFAVAIGNTIDFLQIPYNIGWGVST